MFVRVRLCACARVCQRVSVYSTRMESSISSPLSEEEEEEEEEDEECAGEEKGGLGAGGRARREPILLWAAPRPRPSFSTSNR